MGAAPGQSDLRAAEARLGHEAFSSHGTPVSHRPAQQRRARPRLSIAFLMGLLSPPEPQGAEGSAKPDGVWREPGAPSTRFLPLLPSGQGAGWAALPATGFRPLTTPPPPRAASFPNALGPGCILGTGLSLRNLRGSQEGTDCERSRRAGGVRSHAGRSQAPPASGPGWSAAPGKQGGAVGKLRPCC